MFVIHTNLQPLLAQSNNLHSTTLAKGINKCMRNRIPWTKFRSKCQCVTSHKLTNDKFDIAGGNPPPFFFHIPNGIIDHLHCEPLSFILHFLKHIKWIFNPAYNILFILTLHLNSCTQVHMLLTLYMTVQISMFNAHWLCRGIFFNLCGTQLSCFLVCSRPLI